MRASLVVPSNTRTWVASGWQESPGPVSSILLTLSVSPFADVCTTKEHASAVPEEKMTSVEPEVVEKTRSPAQPMPGGKGDGGGIVGATTARVVASTQRAIAPCREGCRSPMVAQYVVCRARHANG